MVVKNRNQGEKVTRVKVGKLQLNKETIKDLNPDKQKRVKGGATPSVGCAIRCSYRHSGCL